MLIEGCEIVETQETVTFQKNEKGEMVEVVEKVVRTKKTILPSLGAVTFALKNTNEKDLDNDNFSDVQKTEHSGEIKNTGVSNVSIFSIDELRRLANNLPDEK